MYVHTYRAFWGLKEIETEICNMIFNTKHKDLLPPSMQSQKAISFQKLRTYHQPFPQLYKLRATTINIGTMKGRSREIAEMLELRLVDVCCVQEV